MRLPAVVVTVISVAGVANAQPSAELNIERFQLAIDRTGVLDVDSAETPGHLVWSAGMWTGFAHDPLVAYTVDGEEIKSIVDKRLTTGLGGSIGLGRRAVLAVDTTIIGYQSGIDPGIATGDLASSGAGDLRVTGKLQLAASGAWRFAAVPSATVPLGGGKAFLREGGPTLTPAIAVSRFVRRLRLAGTLGYRIREKFDFAGLIVNDEVLVRAAIGYSVIARTELSGSISLATPVKDASANRVAAELLAGVARRFTREVDAFAGAGLGLDNGFGTPDWRVLAGVRYERRPPGPPIREAPPPPIDIDTDGIIGDADGCPNEAEDKDGFRDDDGCPDPDNDSDGIADQDDTCSMQAEDKDGFRDDDGCPDPAVKAAGSVVDGEDRPIAGAKVAINAVDGGTSIEITTSATGEFSADIEGEMFIATVGATDYENQSVTADARNGAVKVKLVRKVRQGQLRGLVQSFDGKPLAATIKISGTASTTATTDAEGRFSVDLGAGAYQVEIESAGHTTQRRSVTVKLDGVTVLNVDLRKN
jgi:large repetitive protein